MKRTPFILSTAAIGLCLSASAIDTSGNSLDISLSSTWSGGSVPDFADNANFVHAGIYTAPSGSSFTWNGIQSNANGILEINSGNGGNAYTIHLGSGGIFGTQNIDRLGANLTLDVGSDDQTWSIGLSNVQAIIAGTAQITYTGATRMWLRGNNTFAGTWKIDGANSGIHPNTTFNWSSSLGARAELVNDAYIRLSNTNYDRFGSIHLVGNGRLLVSGNSTNNGAFASLLSSGSIADSGDIYGTGDLTISSALNYGKLELQGDLDHAGDTIIDNKPAGMTLDLHSASTYTFAIGANGVNNQIRGLSAANSKLLANGNFIFDLSSADTTTGNSWTVVDAASLAATFGNSFTMTNFIEDANGTTWTYNDGSSLWSFSETNGTLSVSGGAPLDSIDVFFMGGQSNAKIDVAIGIEDALRKSGLFNNPTIVWNRHSGQAISGWLDSSTPRAFYDEDLFGQSGSYDQDGQAQGLLETEMNAAGAPRRFRGFFWWQGEADATASSTYATKFQALMSELAADLGQAIGTAADEWTYHIALPDDVAQSYEAIRAAQTAMIDANATVSTYFDTRPYPRLGGDDNPHPPQDLDYFVGVDMANQFLELRGLSTVDMSAAPDSILVKTDTDVLSQNVVTLAREYVMLNRSNAWAPEGIPVASTTLRFDNTLTGTKTYYLGGTSYTPSSPTGTGGVLAIQGMDYQSSHQVSLKPFSLNLDNTLSIGSGGIDASSATSRLVLNVDIETPVPQPWTTASGQSILFNNSNANVDLRNATLSGSGTYDFREGTINLGSQANTATMSFYIGSDLIFADATDAGQASPLGTAATLRTGSASDASFTYDGLSNDSWNRDVNFDTSASGRNARFEIAQPNVTFTSTSSFGVHDTEDTLHLKLGGSGNITITGSGGVKTNGNATCNLEKFGTGTLILSSSGNTFNGSLTITAGTLLVDTASSVNTATDIAVGSGSTTATFEYSSSVALDRDVQVFPGSTFIYKSTSPSTGTLTVAPGGIIIVDGNLDTASLSIPSGSLFVLRGNATIPSDFALTNNGTVDTSTWSGTLPANFINNGTTINASAIKIDAVKAGASNLQIELQGYLGHSYQLQKKEALSTPNWQNVGNARSGTNSTITFAPSTAGAQTGFYQVVVDP
jgi:autotransporter-associated beta strand protein